MPAESGTSAQDRQVSTQPGSSSSQPVNITPELVDKLVDRVMALILQDLQVESDRAGSIIAGSNHPR